MHCSNKSCKEQLMIIQVIWPKLELSLRWIGRSLSTSLPASARDFQTPTEYPNVGDYKGRTGLSPPAAYPSTVGYHHIHRFSYTRAPRSCTKKLPIPSGPRPYGSIGKGYRQIQRNNELPPQPNPTSIHSNYMNVEEQIWTCQDHSIQTIY
jgi:hypothetical protein